MISSSQSFYFTTMVVNVDVWNHVYYQIFGVNVMMRENAHHVASAQKGPCALRVRSVPEKAFSRKSKKEENLQ